MAASSAVNTSILTSFSPAPSGTAAASAAPAAPTDFGSTFVPSTDRAKLEERCGASTSSFARTASRLFGKGPQKITEDSPLASDIPRANEIICANLKNDGFALYSLPPIFAFLRAYGKIPVTALKPYYLEAVKMVQHGKGTEIPEAHQVELRTLLNKLYTQEVQKGRAFKAALPKAPTGTPMVEEELRALLAKLQGGRRGRSRRTHRRRGRKSRSRRQHRRRRL